MVRGALVRKHYNLLQRSQFKLIGTMIKRFNDKVHNVFISSRKISLIKNPFDVVLKITIREAGQVTNKLSQVEISLGDAQAHLFKHIPKGKEYQ